MVLLGISPRELGNRKDKISLLYSLNIKKKLVSGSSRYQLLRIV